MCLYEKVKILCNEKGVKIADMCKETGLKQNTVSNWKDRPNARPSLDNAIALSKYFEVPAEHFLKEE